MEAVSSSTRQRIPGWQRFGLAMVILVLSVFLTLTTYLQPGAALEPGLDSSWAYALNYIYQHSLVLGRDIFFTFGPLGFLEHTRALTNEMVYESASFWFVVSVTLNGCLFVLAFCRPVPLWQRCIHLALVLVLIFFANTLIQRLLMLLYVTVFLHWLTRHGLYLVILCVASTLCLLIKFSYGVAALAMTLPYLLLLVLSGRDVWQAMIGGVIIPLTFVGVWYGVYGHLEGMAGYLQGGLEFSRGSTTAMAVNPQNRWLAVAGFYLAFLWGVVVSGGEHRERRLWLSWCFLGPLFIWSKYAFGREDAGHLAFLILLPLYLFPLMALASVRFVTQCQYGLALIACLFTWHQMHTPTTGQPEFMPRVVYFEPRSFPSRWKPDISINIWRRASEEKLAPLRLPETLRQQIGNSTVDIYPWETLVTAANHLNWVPRPVFQNYITYTPFLDRANRDFYNSARAPEYLVWHYHSFPDIDNRQPFSSDPLTLEAMLRHYRQVACEGLFCVWQRSTTPLLDEGKASPVATVRWNEWIPVPTSAADIVRARATVQRTLAGKLNLAVWKEGDAEIDYRLQDGSIKTHRLLLDNAASGLWASPYLTTLQPASRPVTLTAAGRDALLQAKPAEGYIETASVGPGGLHMLGWGLLPFKDTQTQTLKVLLTNNEQTYVATMANRDRPGITDFFHKTGEVNLENSGFDQMIPLRDIKPGDYTVRFFVEQADGDVAIAPDRGHRITVAPASALHNVEAIRVRTTRPWAFAETIQLQWQALLFTGERPW